MPVFNAGRHLRLAVLSMLYQTFADWELLILDDGSTDGAIQDIGDLRDERIRLIQSGGNMGIAIRLNEGIDLARGRYFARMDADDIAHPTRFRRQLDLLQSNHSLDLVGARCLTISEGGVIQGTLPAAQAHESICARPWLGFYLPHPTWMGRIEWFRENRYGKPELGAVEDQELLLRTHKDSQFAVLPEFLLAYRIRDRVRWKKLLRTRVMLHRVQYRYFSSKKQYAQVLLATLGLCVRIARDMIAILKPVVQTDKRIQVKVPGVSAEIIVQWRALLAEIAKR